MAALRSSRTACHVSSTRTVAGSKTARCWPQHVEHELDLGLSASSVWETGGGTSTSEPVAPTYPSPAGTHTPSSSQPRARISPRRGGRKMGGGVWASSSALMVRGGVDGACVSSAASGCPSASTSLGRCASCKRRPPRDDTLAGARAKLAGADRPGCGRSTSPIRLSSATVLQSVARSMAVRAAIREGERQIFLPR